MNTAGKISIVIGLLVVIAITIAVKQRNNVRPAQEPTGSGQVPPTTTPAGPVIVNIDQRIIIDQGRAATAPSGGENPEQATTSGRERTGTAAAPVQPPSARAALPRLVDLGAGKCIPCKKMAPILEELKKEYAGRMEVEFIDVWENEKAGEKYGIRMIPTQIFYDASGKERFRHEGFFSKEDILGKWKGLGVELKELK